MKKKPKFFDFVNIGIGYRPMIGLKKDISVDL